MTTLESQHAPLLHLFRHQEAKLTRQAKENCCRTIDELRRRLDSGDRQPGIYIQIFELLIRLRQFESAIAILQEGMERCEPDVELYRASVSALVEANRTEEAILVARRAKELFPDAGYFALAEALKLPVLYESEEAIERHRARFSAGLKMVVAGMPLDALEARRYALQAVGQHINFYLGYQGRNDRELQEEYSGFVHRTLAANYPERVRPMAMPPLAPGGKIRVGYISAHFRLHSVAKLFAGWIEQRNRDDFEVFVYHNGGTTDAVTDKVRQLSDHFHHIPGEFEPLCQRVIEDDLHIIVYLDVRHRRMAMMSALRLAPVQCLAWAYPITSGAPMIDYYLSNESMEPEDGEDHYSERMIRLPGIGVYYPKPVIPRLILTRTRADWGLGEDRIVFLCCQSIFKYLPQHDDLFARIAKRLPAAQFVFLSHHSLIGEVFRRRLERAFAAEGLNASDHCVILPQVSTLGFSNLNLVSDVFLDSLEWSGGITAMEAIACGLPVVTFPGKFMRGRHSFGILTQLGVTDTIARDKADYVDIAVRLGQDREWRAQVLERMAAGHERLFSDTRAVRALEEFYRTVVQERLG